MHLFKDAFFSIVSVDVLVAASACTLISVGTGLLSCKQPYKFYMRNCSVIIDILYSRFRSRLLSYAIPDDFSTI